MFYSRFRSCVCVCDSYENYTQYENSRQFSKDILIPFFDASNLIHNFFYKFKSIQFLLYIFYWLTFFFFSDFDLYVSSKIDCAKLNEIKNENEKWRKKERKINLFLRRKRMCVFRLYNCKKNQWFIHIYNWVSTVSFHLLPVTQEMCAKQKTKICMKKRCFAFSALLKIHHTR